LVPLIFAKFEVLHRYLIFGLPFLYLLFSLWLAFFLQKTTIKKKNSIFGTITLILLLLFSQGWNEHRQITEAMSFPLEENLEYLDIIAVGKKVADFIEKYYPTAVV